MTFAQPLWFMALLALPVFWLLRSKGHLSFSDNRLLSRPSRASKFLSVAPTVLGSLTIALLAVALARPQVPGPPIPRTIPGRDIMMAVDISLSMSFPFKGELPKHETPKELEFKVPVSGPREAKPWRPTPKKDGLQRIDASQNAMMRFIENRWQGKTGDRIGLILFDERPRYAWPLTDDLRMLYRQGQFINKGFGLGTNFGEAPPGPIDLAVEHFQENGQADARVLILVSDGEDMLSAHTKARLAELIHENRIRFYMIGIGETLAKNDVDIIKLADSVGGTVFRVEDADSLDRCFQKINEMEKSAITISQLDTSDDVFHYFAWAALVSLALLLTAEAFILTR